MNTPVSLAEIESAIQAASTAAVASGKLDRPDWTDALLTELTALAYAKNLWVASRKSSRDPYTVEWLWDFVMYESDCPKGYRIGRIRLVLESEYDSQFYKIREDLHKVIVARSEMRCFVFWAGDSAHRESVFDFIQGEIAESPNAEAADTYLVAGWSCEPRSFAFRYIKKERPNKAPEPTPGLVMPPAEPGVMPSPGVAHL